MRAAIVSAEGTYAEEQVKKDVAMTEEQLNQELEAMTKEGLVAKYKSALRILNKFAETLSTTLAAKDWLPHIYQDPDFKEFVEMMDKVLTSKGHDYTQGDNTNGDALSHPGRLKNFYELAKMMPGQTPFSVLAVYWWKHVTAVLTFLSKGQVESEPIEGRLVDVVNYSGPLLFKMVRFEQRRKAALKQG